ncbi:hypothetical protein D3C75_752540 [compost metagenome]
MAANPVVDNQGNDGWQQELKNRLQQLEDRPKCHFFSVGFKKYSHFEHRNPHLTSIVCKSYEKEIRPVMIMSYLLTY